MPPDPAPVVCPVVQPGALLRRLNSDDFGFTEGPTNDRLGGIFFCDLKHNRIHRFDTNSQQFSEWATDTQGSNGACFLRSGSLVSCRGQACDVVRWNGRGEVDEVLASTFEGKPFNAPNDLVIARSGWIYFTDPDFDLRSHHPEAVYALSPQGQLQRFETGISRPNGIVLTPDESTLIINGTKQNQLIAWNLPVDGTPADRRVFATVRDPNRAAYTGYPAHDWFGCDGMAMDHDANLYVTCGAGVEVFNRRGDSLGVIVPPEKPTNVCFGGDDRQTLFITAQTSVYAIPCRIPGIVFQQA